MLNGKEELVEVEMILIDEPPQPVRDAISEEGLEELAFSMGKRNLINPITLRKKGERYEIKQGNRRYLAAKSLGWITIKALVGETSDDDVELDMIHENLHREDMTPIEEAKAMKRLIEREGYDKATVARMASKSVGWVDSRLDLLAMPKELRDAVDCGAISIGGARELSKITDDVARAYYLDYAIKQGATATLCAFWRGRWEVEKTVNDPRNAGAGSMELNPPPSEPLIKCWWCERDMPIRILNHLRTCPTCCDVLLKAKAEFVIQQVTDEKGGVVYPVGRE